nr:MAG TPA: hypothetical protein [Caudoviricetes sp.]
MEVMRNMTIDTELFELGDIISFTLITREKVKAKAIRETHNQCRYTLRCKSSKCYCGKYRRLSENGTEQNLSSPHD